MRPPVHASVKKLKLRIRTQLLTACLHVDYCADGAWIVDYYTMPVC